MMSAPVARTSAGRIAFTVAAVPTGMKAGVRMSPRCIAMTPVRAAPSVAATEKVNLVVMARAYGGRAREGGAPRLFALVLARWLIGSRLRLFLRLFLREDFRQFLLPRRGQPLFGGGKHLFLFLVDMVEIAMLHRPESRQPAGRGKVHLIEFGEHLVDFLMLTRTVLGVLAQVGLAHHRRIKREFLGRRVRGHLDAERLEQLLALGTVAMGVVDPVEQVAMPVVIGLESREYLCFRHDRLRSLIPRTDN